MIGNFVGKNPSAELKTKADKVVNATNGDFAGLDNSGNLIDSGYSANDLIVPIATNRIPGKVRPDGITLNINTDGVMSATNVDTVTNVKLGDILYYPINGAVSLPAYPTSLSTSDKTDNYSSTGTAPVTGKAVNFAIQALDVTGDNNIASNKTIKA